MRHIVRDRSAAGYLLNESELAPFMELGILGLGVRSMIGTATAVAETRAKKVIRGAHRDLLAPTLYSRRVANFLDGIVELDLANGLLELVKEGVLVPIRNRSGFLT